LAIATGNFSDDRKLGEGAFGVVYSGFLKRLEREVAVKKIVRESNEEHKDFFAEAASAYTLEPMKIGYLYRCRLNCPWRDLTLVEKLSIFGQSAEIHSPGSTKNRD
jgi:serine/threonine protein kinase